jgi:hypothetical protein
VESFFIKVQKYLPEIRNYSLTFFEEDVQHPRWAMPDVESLLLEELSWSIMWMNESVGNVASGIMFKNVRSPELQD